MEGVSVRKLAEELGITPQDCNRLLVKNGYYVYVDFEKNDGFISVMDYENIEATMNNQKVELIPYEQMQKEKVESIPLGIGKFYVYFLFDGSALVYVGQSCNIAGRINQHILACKKFDSVFTIEVEKSELDKYELMYIMEHKPRLNLHGKDILVYSARILKLSCC